MLHGMQQSVNACIGASGHEGCLEEDYLNWVPYLQESSAMLKPDFSLSG
jgi:hypothetical protein